MARLAWWAKLTLTLTLVVGMLLAGTWAAVALTSWKTFGNGVASGKGSLGSPVVSLTSTTNRNPEELRFVVTSPDGKNRKTDVSWSVWCWNENNFNNKFASGSFERILPITKVIKGVNVARWDFCELDVFAFHIDTGKLKVVLQAKYV